MSFDSAVASVNSIVIEIRVHCRVQMCPVSKPEISGWYEDPLSRPRLAIDSHKVTLALKRIRDAAQVVSPTETVTACTDADDNIFLECAQAAEADYLVTGNHRRFPDRWKKTKVISALELIELLIQQGR